MLRPIAVLYEHPHWFNPLFNELEARRYPFRRIHADEHTFEASRASADLADQPLVFNRMSPSAWKRGRAGAIFHTRDYLAQLEGLGIPTFNGSAIYEYEISKARQVNLLARLGVPVPRTRVVHDPRLLPSAAATLEYPIVVKPNVGGSGAGITLFEDATTLTRSVKAGQVAPSVDGVWLAQEYHRPRSGSIVRLETLAGRYLYGIRVHLNDANDFDLCPADICRTTGGQSLESAACPVGAQKTRLAVEAYTPPDEVRTAVERIATVAHLDVGGIEYLESGRDGHIYFYDVNALSNFVADPERVVGINPTSLLVDALIERANRRTS
ncbi:MAG: ATP-dependent carboxylate-amine ligase [bacterium]|nr:ATP-dependent carboxylate-amine ligase [bacterium]